MCFVRADKVFDNNNNNIFSSYSYFAWPSFFNSIFHPTSQHAPDQMNTYAYLFVLETHTHSLTNQIPNFAILHIVRRSMVDGGEEAGAESSGKYSSTFCLNNTFEVYIYIQELLHYMYTVMRSLNTTKCSTVSDACRVFLGSCLVVVVYAKHCRTSSK